jgi:hypothetical protein
MMSPPQCAPDRQRPGQAAPVEDGAVTADALVEALALAEQPAPLQSRSAAANAQHGQGHAAKHTPDKLSTCVYFVKKLFHWLASFLWKILTTFSVVSRM